MTRQHISVLEGNIVSRHVLRIVLSALVAIWLPFVSAAQERNVIHFVLGFPPGAGFDSLARLLAEQVARELDRPVVVENRTGASGRLAVDYVRRQRPDGNTVLLAPMSAMAIFPHTYRNLSYDPAKDFVPVAALAAFGLAWAVHPDVPASTLAEYVELVKKNPDMGHYGSTGVGTPSHFFATMYEDAADMSLLHVPHRGAADVMTSLLGGHLKAAILTVNDIARQHSAGRVRAIGVSAPQREAVLPEVPTFKESGYDIQGSFWYGAYVPAGTPEATVQRLTQAFLKALSTPEVQNYIKEAGMTVIAGDGQELARIQREDYERWGPVIKATGFVAED